MVLARRPRAASDRKAKVEMARPTCGLPSDLPSDGHEINATAIAESNRIRWSSHRKICSLSPTLSLLAVALKYGTQTYGTSSSVMLYGGTAGIPAAPESRAPVGVTFGCYTRCGLPTRLPQRAGAA